MNKKFTNFEFMAAGRPLLYQSPEELQTAVNDYFDNYDRLTLSGLAVHLGMCRATLYNYAGKDEFLDIIKNAIARVEAIYEARLIWDNSTGVIFPLKNMGWKDKIETGLTDKDGNDVKPTIMLQPAPGCEPLSGQ